MVFSYRGCNKVMEVNTVLGERQVQAVALAWLRDAYDRVHRLVCAFEAKGALCFEEATVVGDDAPDAQTRRDRFSFSLASDIIEGMMDGDESEDIDNDEIINEDTLRNSIFDEAVRFGYLRPEEEWTEGWE